MDTPPDLTFSENSLDGENKSENQSTSISSSDQTNQTSAGNDGKSSEKPPAVSKGTMIFAAIVLVLAAGMGVYYFLFQNQSDEKTAGDDTVTQTSPVPTVVTNPDQLELSDSTSENLPRGGIYEDYADFKLQNAQTGKVVLFFYAEWCPSCNATDLDLINNSNRTPTDLTILKVDYEENEDLKQKYAIPYQHSFVQVDSEGNALKTWFGSLTLEQISENLI